MTLRLFVSLLVACCCFPSSPARGQDLAKRPFAEVARRFESGDASTRIAIAELWGKKRERSAVGVLGNAVTSDRSANVRKKAAFALGAIGSNAAVGALSRATRSDRSSGVRLMAAWALGRLGGGVGALRDALGDSDPAVRIQAAKSLADVRDRSVIPDLRKLLRDRAKPVRTAAVLALQSLGVSDAAIRADLPAAERGGALTAEKKSQGTGVALGLLGAGLIYAGRPVLGWLTLGLEVAGIGMLAAGAAGGAFDTQTVCPETGLPPAPSCSGLPVQQDLNPGSKGLFIGGLILAAGAWLTNVIGTPIAITKYNQRIDEAKRSRLQIRPFFQLHANAGVVGATVRF